MKNNNNTSKHWLGGLFAAMLGLVCCATSAQAQLITNGGFETGDFTGWTLTGNLGSTFVEPSGFYIFTPESGNYFAALGAIGTLDYLSQSVATTAGQTYDLTYFLASDGVTPNEFSTTIGGTTVFDSVDIPAQPWTEYSYDFTATSDSTLVSFGSRNDPAYLALDNVSVTAEAAPEPATWVMLLGGVGLLAFWRLRTGRCHSSHVS